MPVANQRGAPVIYVAGSARELPGEVQDCLGRADTRAVSSPHLYDLLAQLARGRKFAAIIININSVDWAEMGFFDHASRLSRNTPIFVSGSHQQRAKLETAFRRGARLFDALALEDELLCARQTDAQNASMWPPERSACGTAQRPSKPEQSRPAAEPPLAEGHDEPSPEPAADLDVPRSMPVQSRSGWVPRMKLVEDFDRVLEQVDSPAPEPEPKPEPGAQLIEPESPPAGLEQSTAGQPVRREETDVADNPVAGEGELQEQVPNPDEPNCAAQQQSPLPTTEPQDAEKTAADATAGDQEDSAGGQDVPVVFPWTVNPNRPKRTPPQMAGDGAKESAEASPPREESPESASKPLSASPFRSVHLTAEEIAALMGHNPPRQSSEDQP